MKFSTKQTWMILTGMLLVFFISYSCTTKSKNGALTGIINLVNDSGDASNDPVDFSGITIALYEPAILDTAIVRANQLYPQIGILINQETEFDHREHTASYSATTLADGSFKLKEIAPGKYNIVLFKLGWGWKYFLECQIKEGTNNLTDFAEATSGKQTFELYPERVIVNYDQIQLLQSGHFYIIENDVTLLQDLVLEEGANLLLYPRASLTIIGLFQATSGGFSYVSVYGSDIDLENCFGRILAQGGVDIDGVVFSYSLNGIQFQGGAINATRLRVKHGYSGIVCRNSNEVDVSHVVVSDIGQLVTTGANVYSTDGGIDLTSCSNSQVRQSVIVRCNSGVKVREFCYTTVKDSFFANNTIGAEGLVNTAIYEYNHFQSNYSYDIRVYGTCSPVIRKNDFNSVRGVNIGLNTLLAFLNCTPLITQNNFNCQVFAIRIMGNNMIDIDATYNYYYSTNQDVLADIIWDQNDYNPDDWSSQIISNTAYINYIPYLTHKVQDAGIRL